jgi:hypothetical protein
MSRAIKHTACRAAAIVLLASVSNAESVPDDAATKCLTEARELLEHSKFLEASEKYLCASHETMRLGANSQKVTEYQANANLYRSWGLYAKTKVNGMFARSDLDREIQLAEQARDLWRRAQNRAAADSAEGWRLYLEGVRYAVDNNYSEARQRFEKARQSFLDLEERVPGISESTQPLVKLAEEQALSVSLAEVWQRTDSATELGELNRKLSELGDRANPADRAVYEGIGELARGQGRLKDGSDRLVGWQYSDAARLLREAEEALAAARAHFSASVEAPLSTSGQYIFVVDGWTAVTRAEQHHAKALEALLERGDAGRAKNEFIEGMEAYATAQTEFEKAFFGSQAIRAIRQSKTRLEERAQVVASVFGLTRFGLDVGEFFVAIFFGTLGVLTLLAQRFRLAGRTIVWIALVVGIIGAFGLHAPDFFYAIKALPKLS